MRPISARATCDSVDSNHKRNPHLVQKNGAFVCLFVTEAQPSFFPKGFCEVYVDDPELILLLINWLPHS